MTTEQEKTLEAVKTAIRMEVDGKAFYLEASHESGNELGRKLFQSLAAEEDLHRQRFEEIYDTLRNKKDWPKVTLKLDSGKSPKTLFAQAIEGIGSDVKAAAAELDAVKISMEMENKTYDFYKNREKNASYDAERDFFQRLAAEETTHHMVLLDYYEYLKDPAGWFVKKEHHSLDGG
ncbi:ferritin family protein [Chloroflexota bacterium]